MSKKLNISKISDKEVILDVQGQENNCAYDCLVYLPNTAGDINTKCGYFYTPQNSILH